MKILSNLSRPLIYASVSLLLMIVSFLSHAQKPTASALDDPSGSASSSQSACCGYWAAIELGNGLTTYSASNVFRSQACDIANDHVWKYVESIIGHKEKGGAFVIYCKSTRQEIEDKIRAPASYRLVKQWNIPDDPVITGGSSNDGQSSAAVSGNGTSSPDSSNNDDSDRANERTRLFNQQNGRTTVINPDGSRTTKLVRKPGESEEDFRARQRAVAYEDQKRNGTNDDAAWTEEDGKKYTQGKKGHWEIKSFTNDGACINQMQLTIGYGSACIVNEKGLGDYKGTFLELTNSSSKYPFYYGLSGVFNKMVKPNEKITEDLHMYQPIDPAKKAKEPNTVVDIMVKYWVETP